MAGGVATLNHSTSAPALGTSVSPKRSKRSNKKGKKGNSSNITVHLVNSRHPSSPNLLPTADDVQNSLFTVPDSNPQASFLPVLFQRTIPHNATIYPSNNNNNSSSPNLKQTGTFLKTEADRLQEENQKLKKEVVRNRFHAQGHSDADTAGLERVRAEMTRAFKHHAATMDMLESEQKQSKALRADLANSQRIYDRINQKLRNSTNMVAEAQEETERYKAELAEAHQKIERLQARQDDIEMERARTMMKNAELQAESINNKNMLNMVKKEAEGIKQKSLREVKEITETHDNLEKKAVEAIADLKKARAELFAEREQHAACSAQLEAQESTSEKNITQLTNEVEQLKQALANMQQMDEPSRPSRLITSDEAAAAIINAVPVHAPPPPPANGAPPPPPPPPGAPPPAPPLAYGGEQPSTWTAQPYAGEDDVDVENDDVAPAEEEEAEN